MSQADLIWMNGELVAWEDAKVHVLTHALHYGTGVFEGIRAYDTPRGPAVFRHAEHIDRLFRSASMYFMDIPYGKEQIREATHELIARNGLRSCYVRPVVYRGAGLFEPVHGSAPDIAGTGKANPLAMLGSVAMMLRHGFSLEDRASALESAIDRALEEGLRTPDLGGEATTEDAVRAVLSNL